MQPRCPHPAAVDLCNVTYANLTVAQAGKLIDIYFHYSGNNKYFTKRSYFSAHSKCQFAHPFIYQLTVELLAECSAFLFQYQHPEIAKQFASYLIKLVFDTKKAKEVKAPINKMFVALSTYLTAHEYRLFTQKYVLSVDLSNDGAKTIYEAICHSFTVLTRPQSEEDIRHCAIYENRLAGVFNKAEINYYSSPSLLTNFNLFYCEDGFQIDCAHEEIKNSQLYPHPSGS